ncbi:MAG: chloride channel protein, partial [Butyricicoccus sp.]|nr:chloride channel protein [Butyricicoccus sp.]
MAEKKLNELRQTARMVAKWTILALAVGIVVGVVGAVFAHAVTWATATRKAHGWLLYFLPFAGVFIVWLYRRCGM